MVTDSMTSKKHCVLVFPANGCMGYDMCRNLVEGAKKDHCEEVYAVCCSSEGKFVNKLKDLGKKCKVICLDMASDMDCWKKQVKDKVDCMMLCTDPSAMRHMKSKATEENHAHMAKAMECAVEMCQHLSCKCIVETTAYCADDSKYKMWHHMHNCMEKAMEKHFKGHCCVMYHQMMFECMMMNREELCQEKKMSWPCSTNAECCPMSMCDIACCCIDGMRECMKDMESGSGSGVMATVMSSAGMNSSKKCMKYHVTGRDMMTPQKMMDMMSQSLGQAYQYQQIDESQWKKMVQDHLCMMEMEMAMECFRMMDDGKMKHCTHDMKKLTDREPMNMPDWIKKHQSEFGQGATAQSSMMM